AHLSRARATALASESIFEDSPVHRPARRLASELGKRIGGFSPLVAPKLDSFQAVAAQRFVPNLSQQQWANVVLAAGVRAYVSLVDAHGAWAPLDEEWSLYSAELAAESGPRLWGNIERTAAGLRVLEDPAPPLEKRDLVLSVAGIVTAGLSLEQLEQLSQLEPVGKETNRKVLVARGTAPDLLELDFQLPDQDAESPESDSGLNIERVRYGAGTVLVVALSEIAEDLGDRLAAFIQTVQVDGSVQGVVLDLRGNGGGSADGAAGAIGVFLPGVASFSLLHRSGNIEIDHALVPAEGGYWPGPVAVLVDGLTASAAEMLAGAILAYGRGPLIGTRTFGKGCVQEYFDDSAGAGVLRLTTMLFALPDGSALQRVGMEPQIWLPFPAAEEREGALPGTPPSWGGPDVRTPALISHAPWPRHGARVGPCRDRWLCAALRRLGASPSRIAGSGPRRAAAR
ncbi:MAG TPA: S41 family peptidase, partial [Polyangiaceae bacterium]